MASNVVEAVHQIREYCESFGSCSHGCMFFDSEKFSCKLDEQPHMWSLSDLPSKDEQEITIVSDILVQLGDDPDDEETAWIELQNGRSIEIMVNKLGKAWYAVRLHCSSVEYDAGKFHKTLGVIEQYCTTGLSEDGLRKAVKHLLYCNDIIK